jgi:ketosteroid isomerase-like protein
MSEENLELARKVVEYWNRGDLDALFDLGDEDQMLRAAEGWPERVQYGRDAIRSFYAGLVEVVGHDAVIVDLVDAGDSVVLRTRQHFSGEQSGLKGDLEFSQVLTFRRGKIIMQEFFWDHQEALEAVGLSDG